MVSYSFASAIGFNLIAIVAFLIAILTAKKVSGLSWTLFVLGGGVTVIALMGQSKSIAAIGSSYVYSSGLQALKQQHTINVAVFVILALVAAFLISARSNAGKQERSAEAQQDGSDPAAQADAQTDSAEMTENSEDK